MKFLGQTKDGVTDKLLRAYVSRPSNPRQECTDFDPDRANSYIERSLTGTDRFHYEAHLSECAACRKNVVALVRLAKADTVAHLSPAREVARSAWFSGAKQMFGALSQPQWAMAATAVIVLAVSLPLFLSRNQARDASLATAVESDAPQSATAPASSVDNPPSSGEGAPALLATSRQREKSDEKSEALARNASASSTAADSAAGFAAGVELSKKAETSAAQTVDEAQRKSGDQLSQAPAQPGAAPGSQVAKNDSDQNRQQQSEKVLGQRANEAKLAARADEERAKEKTDRVEDVAAPPSAASSSEVARAGGGMKRPGRLSLRDSGSGEAVRPEERKFSGKKFLFRDGAWTDKDYDPNKDLPVVTIIRDSNVYAEVLNKRPGLKPFLTGFPATERAIIVYKGTVYKLIPQ